MKEELISLETAKLAKEKGFDVETFRYYNDGGKIWTFHNYGLGLPYPEACYAPTQSLLQKWLRDNHDLHITPTCYGEWYAIVSIKVAKLVELKEIKDYGGYDSYEQSLEKGLLEALKLVEQ